jgi:hypothetical protein
MTKSAAEPKSEGKPKPEGKPKSEGKPMPGWSVPVRLDDVTDKGLHVALVADAATCVAVAKLIDVDAVLRLEATYDIVPHAATGMTVMGTISARVRQTCVLTLDAIENEISEPVGVTFTVPDAETDPLEVVIAAEGDEDPEPLVNGAADLGHLTTELLALAIDRYPRKPGVAFQPPAAPDHGGSPFDALAVLKKDGNQPS